MYTVVCHFNVVCVGYRYRLVRHDGQNSVVFSVGVVLAVYQRFAAVCRADNELCAMYVIIEPAVPVCVINNSVAEIYNVIFRCDVCVDLLLVAVLVENVNTVDADVSLGGVFYLHQYDGLSRSVIDSSLGAVNLICIFVRNDSSDAAYSRTVDIPEHLIVVCITCCFDRCAVFDNDIIYMIIDFLGRVIHIATDSGHRGRSTDCRCVNGNDTSVKCHICKRIAVDPR